MLATLDGDKDATWSSADRSFRRFCISESETSVGSWVMGFLILVFREAADVMIVDELDSTWKGTCEKEEGT